MASRVHRGHTASQALRRGGCWQGRLGGGSESSLDKTLLGQIPLLQGDAHPASWVEQALA